MTAPPGKKITISDETRVMLDPTPDDKEQHITKIMKYLVITREAAEANWGKW